MFWDLGSIHMFVRAVSTPKAAGDHVTAAEAVATVAAAAETSNFTHQLSSAAMAMLRAPEKDALAKNKRQARRAQESLNCSM